MACGLELLAQSRFALAQGRGLLEQIPDLLLEGNPVLGLTSLLGFELLQPSSAGFGLGPRVGDLTLEVSNLRLQAGGRPVENP